MSFQQSITLFALLMAFVEGYVRYTNIKCMSFDPTFSNFSECKLKVLGRNTIGLNITLNMFQLPINDVTLNADCYKKANGYRPFLYNVTVDFCDFMKNPKRFPVFNVFSDIRKEFSNLNHTCPYNHDFIMRNAIIRDDHFKYIPVPEGDYLLKITVGVNDKWIAVIEFYGTASDLALG